MIDLNNMSIAQLKSYCKEKWNAFANIPTIEKYNEYSMFKKALERKGVVMDFVDVQECTFQ